MKHLFYSIALAILVSCSSQKTITDTAVKNSKGNLVGVAQKESFNQEPYNSWFQSNYDFYTVNKEVLNQLKPLLKGVKIKAFMGTWCGDSQEQIPPFYKILDLSGFEEKNLELIAVNRRKKTPDNLQKGYDIIRVPTFIFYKNSKEIGRFVEYPRETLEEDFLKIVSGRDYKHSYVE